MGRCSSLTFAVLAGCVAGALLLLSGCSGSSPVTTTTFAVPASITLSPSPSASIELGNNITFLGTPMDATNTALNEPIVYQSSNTAVVTIASNGLACAGSWDSLTNPQICTPGSVGVATITATAQGISSPGTAVYVHQKIDKVTVNQFTPPNLPPPTLCQSTAQNANHNAYYEAHAFSRGIDITPTVGQFTFQELNAAVASMSNTSTVLANMVNGVSLNQIEATAKTPGITSVFAKIGNAVSTPATFITCRVESIFLDVTGQSSNSKTITPTVLDEAGNQITQVPLTWSSSESASATVSASGVATATSGGGTASIIGSCTPPTCNIGFLPSLPIYPENVVTITSTSGTPPSRTVYVSSTGCGTTDNCFTVTIPVTIPGSTYGTIATLPATPNSMVFDRQGTRLFFGTNTSELGSKGLGVLQTSANTVTEFPSTPGKVLAVSPDGGTVIVSDTVDAPNQVFVFNTKTNASQAFRITGATAADFSPDNLKAYIVAGSTLYVYSKLDALQSLPLGAPANDVSFLSEGAFAYVAGGSPSAVTTWWTCSPGQASVPTATPGTPTFIKTLPDASAVVAIDPPTMDVIHVSATPQGCTPAVSNSVTSFDLGHGSFVAKQMIVSPDGSVAYILTPSTILVFNITAQTSSGLSLAGNAVPLRLSLSSDGQFLYAGASDGLLHVLQTSTGGDITQVPFPQGFCQDSVGNPFKGLTCLPDLVAVKP